MGYTISTSADLAATMKAKLDVDLPLQVILIATLAALTTQTQET